MARWGWVLSTVFAVTIDQASFEPVYRQLARILREQIQAGELRPGSALPSEASLSRALPLPGTWRGVRLKADYTGGCPAASHQAEHGDRSRRYTGAIRACPNMSSASESRAVDIRPGNWRTDCMSTLADAALLVRLAAGPGLLRYVSPRCTGDGLRPTSVATLACRLDG